MPLKNYTTQVPASKSIEQVQSTLARHGATGVLLEYEQGTGRLSGLAFKIDMDGRTLGFRLPVKYREAREALLKQKIRRADRDQDYVYRVAWRILKDWVDAQMALLELELVELPQIFLPYAITANDKTLYENVKADPRMLLGPGK